MSKRYPGGYLTASPVVPTSTAAPGVWTLEQQYQAQGAGNWPAAANYQINKSLRFRQSATAYLNRTPASASNRKTWTWSGWVKRGNLTSYQFLLDAYYAGNTDGFRFDDAGRLDFILNDTADAQLTTNAQYRDPSAWYHIVAVYDTTQATASNRLKFYVNGVQITSFLVATYPSQNRDGGVNNNVTHKIGQYVNSSSQSCDGEMAEVNFIDGQALTPSSFGTTDAYGIWQPIPFSGTYGTNGYYLPFRLNTASTYYGSFSGSSSNLQVANSAVFNAPGTQNFTVEGWYYLNSIPSSGIYGFWGCDNGSGSVPKQTAYIDTSGLVHFDVTLTGGASTATTSTALTTGKWYHLAWVRNGSTFTIYVNGVSAATGTSSVNLTGLTQPFYVGYVGEPSGTFSGLVSNFRYVLGTAIYTANFTPPTSPLTNVSGTVLLTLQNSSIVDNSSNAFSITNNGYISTAPTTYNFAQPTLTADYSGNYNNWTTNNISLTTGSTYDSMYDSPTNNSSTVANYATLNPVWKAYSIPTISNGNLTQTSNAAAAQNAFASIGGITSGKWYYEMTVTNINSGLYFGICDLTTFTSLQYANGLIGDTSGGFAISLNNGNKYTNGGSTSYGSAFSSGDTAMVAFDATNGTLWFGKNGTWFNSGDPVSGSNPGYSGLTSSTGYYFGGDVYTSGSAATYNWNFGQQPFTYTAPTGFLPLNTYNLPSSNIMVGNQVMDATLYTGNGTSLSVTNTAGFKPDFVWLKSRSNATNNTQWDSIRGATNYLVSNTTAAQATYAGGLTSFNSNGFSIGDGSDINVNAATYVGWQWQAGQGTTSSNTNGSITSTVSVNPTAGFSVVTFTGGSGNNTVGHGLGVAPNMVILKRRNSVSAWAVYHSALSNPATSFLELNTTSAVQSASPFWGASGMTSTTIGTSDNVTINGATYVAYCWAAVAGYSAFGSYTGNGSADGPFIYTGFRPKFVIARVIDQASFWNLYDSARDPYNVTDHYLYPNSSNAEGSGGNDKMDFLSNGFKIRGTGAGTNSNGSPAIYMAFAENPFKIARAR